MKEKLTHSGRFVPSDIYKGEYAFIPKPLPTKKLEVNKFEEQLKDIKSSIEELNNTIYKAKNVGFVVDLFLIREAIKIVDRYLYSNPNSNKQIIIKKCKDGLVKIFHKIRNEPISNEFICYSHQVLFSGLPEFSETPGIFREEQTIIGKENSRGDRTIFYITSPVQEMKNCLEKFENYIQQNDGVNFFIKCSLVLYQFIAIHPFLNGNGRIGRLLVPILLYKENFIKGPVLFVSKFMEERKADGYNLFKRIVSHGEWENWIKYVLEGIVEESKEAKKHIEFLISNYSNEIENYRIGSNQIIEMLTKKDRINGESNSYKYSTFYEYLYEYFFEGSLYNITYY